MSPPVAAGPSHNLVSSHAGGGGGGAHGGSAEDIGGIPLPAVVVWGNLAIYVLAWALLMWPQHLPLGRPGIAIVFAALACGLRAVCVVAWPEQNYPNVDVFSKIEVTPLALLFGLMLVNAYLKDTGIWDHAERLLDSASPRRMLVKLCILSAFMSAILLNDTTCFVLTPVVLSLCAKRKARSNLPFLLALSTSSNIGSSLTIIGNPQNALIAVICPSITFLGFVGAMLAPVCIGLVINTAALLLQFRSQLVFEAAAGADDDAGVADIADIVLQDIEAASELTTTPRLGAKWYMYLGAVALVVAGMLAGWTAGLATDHVAIAAGTALMLARAMRRRLAGGRSANTETEFALGAVDYSILILFAGQFILVGATVDTGLPQQVFKAVLGSCADQLDASPTCIFWFSVMVLVLSNVIGNVPVILMLQPLLMGQPADSVHDIWVLCAWVATVAGNFTMLGSAANLIVAHAAESRGERSFTATAMAKFSILPTLAVAAVGIALLPPIGTSLASGLALLVLGCAAGAVFFATTGRALLSRLLLRRGRKEAPAPLAMQQRKQQQRRKTNEPTTQEPGSSDTTSPPSPSSSSASLPPTTSALALGS